MRLISIEIASIVCAWRRSAAARRRLTSASAPSRPSSCTPSSAACDLAGEFAARFADHLRDRLRHRVEPLLEHGAHVFGFLRTRGCVASTCRRLRRRRARRPSLPACGWRCWRWIRFRRCARRGAAALRRAFSPRRRRSSFCLSAPFNARAMTALRTRRARRRPGLRPSSSQARRGARRCRCCCWRTSARSSAPQRPAISSTCFRRAASVSCALRRSAMAAPAA